MSNLSTSTKLLDPYKKRAKRYFKELNTSENAPPDVREKRKEQLDEIRAHLKMERGLIESLAQVQARLELYRAGGRDATVGARSEVAKKQTVLLAEEHHPTAQLEGNMRAVPVPKPSSKHTAHHIVPGKGKTTAAYDARVIMHMWGVRINDPDNGVWLPTYSKYTPSWTMPSSKGHLEYHTHGYEAWVLRKLRATGSECGFGVNFS